MQQHRTSRQCLHVQLVIAPIPALGEMAEARKSALLPGESAATGDLYWCCLDSFVAALVGGQPRTVQNHLVRNIYTKLARIVLIRTYFMSFKILELYILQQAWSAIDSTV